MNAIIFTAVFGIFILFSGLFLRQKRTVRLIAVAGMAIGFILNWINYYHPGTDWPGDMIHADHASILFNAIAMGCTFIYFLLSGKDFETLGEHVAEYFALVYFILCGVAITASFTNLLMLFLSVEIISIPQYILAGSEKKNLKSNEASLKYFLMGAFSTGFLLMGIALVYGATGTFNIYQMQLGGSGINPLVLAGILFLIVGLSFKVSAAPFHFWAPDVYDGAPSVVTSFMSTVVKAAGFIAFIRLFSAAFSADNITTHWTIVLAVIASATLIIGNFTAVFQVSVKRMLAYSSISQAGFMLLAVIGLGSLAWDGILLYAAAYSVATIGAFAVLIRMDDFTLEGYRGLGKKQPVVALANTVFLLSLTGIPATAGFMAKYFVLSSALQRGGLLWLVILAVCCAAVSAYYYFRVIWAIYFQEGEPSLPESRITPAFKWALALTAILVIAIGVFPGIILNWLP
jgi:NADH-quinone oxidoreductase subunit N